MHMNVQELGLHFTNVILTHCSAGGKLTYRQSQ